MHYTAITMGHHVRAQAAGGISVAAYCKAHHLRPSMFYYWRRKLAEEDSPPEELGGFTELRPWPELNRRGLRLPSGLYLDLVGLSLSEIADLIIQIDRAHA